jgi:glutathione S-transferase
MRGYGCAGAPSVRMRQQRYGRCVLKILQEPRAPNPRRVRIFLAEKGIVMAYEAISLQKGEHKSEAFLRLNPFAQVPTLVLDDGSTLTESVAICRYFEELHPEPALFGKGARGQAEVEMWNRRIELGLLLPVGHCLRHTHPAMAALEQPQIAQWGEVNRGRALEVLGLIDGVLRQSPFIAGRDLSIADITLLVALDFMKPAKIVRPVELSGVERWYGEMAARPSAAA